ncbi:FG-GAP and VCBS repeat-containing protein [Streptomyces sp. NPDC050564]|uniref:FG-GAP and VCBS repeat-containing protein n=1 Tax=Streptomyces sp. NPDC050564 TaxID=3365631 RepID=UPI00379D961F
MSTRKKAWRVGLTVALSVTGAVAVTGAGHAEQTQTTSKLRSDFNGDGYQDLAVTAPAATVGGKAKAGYVAVIYGSSTGLKTSTRQVFSQSTAGIPGVEEAGDAYGSDIATTDLDQDGYADLVVGASGEDIGTMTDAGSVAVIWGGAKGLSGGATLYNGASAYYLVGHQVAAGDFDGDGDQEVVTDDAVTQLKVLSGPFGRDGSASGATSLIADDIRFMDLATGDLNGDGITDLVSVVHDGDEGDSRRIAYWAGTPSGPGPYAEVRTADDRRLQGGEVLGIGDVNKDGYDDIVVGRADGMDSDLSVPLAKGGMVTYVPGSASGPVADKAKFFNQDSPGVPGVAEGADGRGGGDYFGSSISVGDIDGDGYADVAVGVPGEDFDGTTRAGSVVTMRGTASGLTGSGAKVFSQNTDGVPGTAENQDVFGWATRLTDANRDGRAELAVGAPGENTNAGSVWVFKSTASGVTPTGSYTFGAGTLDTVAAGARLGQGFAY